MRVINAIEQKHLEIFYITYDLNQALFYIRLVEEKNDEIIKRLDINDKITKVLSLTLILILVISIFKC